MGCGCGGKGLPKPAPQRWSSIVNKTYRNTTEETLRSRNPRFEVASGETIDVSQEMINYTVRMWIRTGALVSE